ncbi:FAD-dependent oxidoreductase [Streptomyces sp. NPDC005904]|uniref:FAD-dependent oxidoreductase n=1 Tax=Streptomyces sp. NPDC005904 TaxID=3154570 RepID=UPI0033E8F95E
MAYDADVIVIGAGLAGLAATAELVDAGRRVILVDQEPEQSIGGQAHWSFGGLFFVDSPEQRRLRIKDSHALALQDWLGTAAFDRPEDHWPRKWAEAYVDFAAASRESTSAHPSSETTGTSFATRFMPSRMGLTSATSASR